MNIKKIIIIVLIFFTFFLNKSFCKENKILIRVNNEIITTIDILNEVRFLSIMNAEFREFEQDKKIEIAKNSLIKDKIKLIEILKYRKNLDVESPLFENIVKNYFPDLKIKNLNEFENYFNKQNLDLKFLKQKISIETFWNRLIFEKFSKNVKINKNEIETEVLSKEKQKEYLLSEIVFNVSNNEKLDDKINLISKTIVEKSFAKAALNFSISDTTNKGGKLGWIKENILSDDIKIQISKTKIGNFTKPIVIPGGFIILKVENVRVIKRKINEEKEIQNIINKKTNDQLRLFSNIYLNKLKKNIEINET